MYRLNELTLKDMVECSAALRVLGRRSSTLEEAAQRIVDWFYTEMGDPESGLRDCVMVQCCKTGSSQDLGPADRRVLAEEASGQRGRSAGRCLRILASAGDQNGTHLDGFGPVRAVPLTDEALARRAPVCRQLLGQLGVITLQIEQGHRTARLAPLDESSAVLYIPDFAGSPYALNSAEMPDPSGVHSVLAFAGKLPLEEHFVITLFLRGPVPRETVELVRPLALSVAVALLPFHVMAAVRASYMSPQLVGGREGDALTRTSVLLDAGVKALEQLLEIYDEAVSVQSDSMRLALRQVEQRAASLARSEHSIREQMRIVNSIMRSMGDGVVVIDRKGKTVLVNPAVESILGFPPQDVSPLDWVRHYKGLYLSDTVTPFPAAEWPLSRALHGGKVDWQEIYIRRAHDQYGRWVSINARPLIGEVGTAEGAVAVFHDITWLKRAQLALHESEHRFRSLVESAQDIIFTTSQDGIVTSLNPAFESVTKWSRTQWIGESFVSLLHPDDVTLCQDVFDAILNRGASLTCSMHLSVKEGGYITGEFVGTPQIQNGKVVGLLGVLRDITERKRIEEALRDGEERLRSIVQSTKDAIILISGVMNIAFWNKGAELTFGYTAEEIVGEPAMRIIPERYQAVLLRSMQRARVAERMIMTNSTLEVVGVRKNGEEFPLEFSLAAWKGKSDIFFTVIMRDTTERRHAERELDRLHRHNQLVLHSAGEGIYGLDEHGCFTFVNPAAAKMLGWDAADLIGRPMHEIVHQSNAHEDACPEDACPIYAASREGTVLQVDHDLFSRKDGQRFPVEYVSTPIWEHEKLVGAVVVFKDTTERKRTEERLQESLRRVRTLSGQMEKIREEERRRIARELHDELGVGLTCLKIDLSQLNNLFGEELGGARRSKFEERVTAMREQVDATIASVQRIVAELRPGVLDDLGLVAAIEWQCRDFQRRTGIPCACTVGQDDLHIDPQRATAVFRICQEALTNVARHAEATDVQVHLMDRDGWLNLEVSDNGRGIMPEQVGALQSFGLMGMRERAELFGGQVAIESRVREGTTVTLRLPR